MQASDEMCYHPYLVPTQWNQPKPEPTKMSVLCRCGENVSCLTCGNGHGSHPCTCAREDEELREEMWPWQQAAAEAFWNFEQSFGGSKEG